MIGVVGEHVDFSYVAAARDTDGDVIPLSIRCPASANPLVIAPTSTTPPIVTVTLKDAARDEAQVNFTCQLSSLLTGFIQDIIGTIIVSS